MQCKSEARIQYVVWMKNSCTVCTSVSTTRSMPALPGLYKNRSWDHSQLAISAWSRTFTSNKHSKKEHRRLKQSQKWAKRKEEETESKNSINIQEHEVICNCRVPQVWKNKRYWLQWNQKWINHLANTPVSDEPVYMCYLRGVRQS